MRSWRDRAREDARAILQAALTAVAPQVAMRQVRREGDALVLPDGARVSLDRHVRLVALGKAAGSMAAQAQAWGPFEEALVVAPHEVDLPGFESVVGAHPVPDERSVAAGERTLAIARACEPGDLLLVLLSGGASAMAEAPEVPLDDLRQASALLLASGAPIEELNLVRRHLSRLKGGGLARACRGEMLVLCISDVDDARDLGSGPAWPAGTAPREARGALEARGLWDAMPARVRERLAAEGDAPPAEARPRHVVLADNGTALAAAAATARGRGYATRVLPGFLRGEARERGRELGALARAPREGPVALLAGGETTVRVVGSGRGGRNQEVALAAVDALSGQDALLATLGTDGVDGPTDAAGALVDGMTRARADALGLDANAHLAENDAYAYFEALDDLVRTGPTGTNVRDLAILLAG